MLILILSIITVMKNDTSKHMKINAWDVISTKNIITNEDMIIFKLQSIEKAHFGKTSCLMVGLNRKKISIYILWNHIEIIKKKHYINFQFDSKKHKMIECIKPNGMAGVSFIKENDTQNFIKILMSSNILEISGNFLFSKPKKTFYTSGFTKENVGSYFKNMNIKLIDD